MVAGKTEEVKRPGTVVVVQRVVAVVGMLVAVVVAQLVALKQPVG